MLVKKQKSWITLFVQVKGFCSFSITYNSVKMYVCYVRTSNMVKRFAKMGWGGGMRDFCTVLFFIPYIIFSSRFIRFVWHWLMKSINFVTFSREYPHHFVNPRNALSDLVCTFKFHTFHMIFNTVSIDACFWLFHKVYCK